MVSALPIISKPLDANPDHLVWEALSADTRNTDPNKVRKIPKSIFITPNLNTSKISCPPGMRLSSDGKCLQSIQIDHLEILKQQIQQLTKNDTTDLPADFDYEYGDEHDDGGGGGGSSSMYAVPPLSLGFSDERRPPPYPSRIVQQDTRTPLPTTTTTSSRSKEPFRASTDSVTQRQPVTDTRSKTEIPVAHTGSSSTSATATETPAPTTIQNTRHHPTLVDRILFSSVSTPNSNINRHHSQNMEYSHEYATEFSAGRRRVSETVPIRPDTTTVLVSTTTNRQFDPEIVKNEKILQDAKTEVNTDLADTNVKKDISDRIEILPLMDHTSKPTITTTNPVSDAKRTSFIITVPATTDGKLTTREEFSTSSATSLDDRVMETSSDTRTNPESPQTSPEFSQISSELPQTSSESIVITSLQGDDPKAVSTKETTAEELIATHKLHKHTNVPFLSSHTKSIETTPISERSPTSHITLPSLSLTSHPSSLYGPSDATSTSVKRNSPTEHTYEVENSDKPISIDGEEIEIMKKIDKLIDGDDDDYTDDSKNLTALMEEELFLQGNGMILTNYGNNNDNHDDHINSNISEIDYTVSSATQSSPSSSLAEVLDVKATDQSKMNPKNSSKIDDTRPTVYSTFMDALASSSSLFNRNSQLNPSQRVTLEPSTRASEDSTQNPAKTDADAIKSSPVLTTATTTETMSSVTTSTTTDKLIDKQSNANFKHRTIDDDGSNNDDDDDDDSDNVELYEDDEHVDGGSVTNDDLNNSDKTIRLGINCYLKNYLKHFYIMCT